MQFDDAATAGAEPVTVAYRPAQVDICRCFAAIATTCTMHSCPRHLEAAPMPGGYRCSAKGSAAKPDSSPATGASGPVLKETPVLCRCCLSVSA